MAVEPDEESAALDLGGVTPRIAALAREAMGTGSVAEQAERLEQYLVSEYEYTLDVLGRGGDSAIETFLFQDRRGHCELFASSMVLMLRSQGIPARLVTGFLGGQQNRLEDYFMSASRMPTRGSRPTCRIGVGRCSSRHRHRACRERGAAPSGRPWRRPTTTSSSVGIDMS